MRSPLILWSIAGVPSSRALPCFPITAPPPVCVPDVIGASAVRIQNGKKITYRQTAATSAVCLFFYFGVVSTQLVFRVQPTRTQVEAQYWGNSKVAQLQGTPARLIWRRHSHTQTYKQKE